MTRLLEHLLADADEEERRTVDAPTDLRFVGPATAEAIEAAEFSAQAIVDTEVSYRMLCEAGVNPGVAAKIRRHHSLPWSFDTDGDLDRRSEQVRGLQDEEAAWVASSLGGEGEVETVDAAASEDGPDEEAAWVAGSGAEDAVSLRDGSDDPATADGSGDPLAAEAAWRERSKPTPLTELSGIDRDDADRLAAAGVTSVRSLATADPELLADATGIAGRRLRRWHREASELAD